MPSSVGVNRPKMLTATLSRVEESIPSIVHILIFSIAPWNGANGPSTTLTTSLTRNTVAAGRHAWHRAVNLGPLVGAWGRNFVDGVTGRD